jgi:RNase P subunit RPR2
MSRTMRYRQRPALSRNVLRAAHSAPAQVVSDLRRSAKKISQPMNTGKCPKCNAVLNGVDVENIAAHAGQVWRAVSYICPECKVILGVQIDPLMAQSQILAAIENAKGDLAKSMESQVRRVQAQLSFLVDSERRRLDAGSPKAETNQKEVGS